MADVRSMLRAERASRRITHPNASYTSDGKLSCNLCEILVKTESAWQGHLHSTGHTLRLGRARDVASTRGAETAGGRKRKAEDEDEGVEERKKVRADAPVSEIMVRGKGGEERSHTPSAPLLPSNATTVEHAPPTANGSHPDPAPADSADSNDDAELAAFERELAEMEAVEQQSAAQPSAAHVISAAPVTAEELAAQAREEQSAQRGSQRDADIEGEREDAARVLEGEFEEMEGLEDRVRKLRERREALRKGDGEAAGVGVGGGGVVGMNGSAGHGVAEKEDDDDDDDDDDDEEDEDVDEWGFGSR